MQTLSTARLQLRPLTLADAPFILHLLNTPGWKRFIGDKGVYTLAHARAYLRQGPLASYARHGFGLYAMVPHGKYLPIGMCGILKRHCLSSPDLGFAILPEYSGQGYTHEAATAVLHHTFSADPMEDILAITSPDNQASRRLLEKLGFEYEGEEPYGKDMVNRYRLRAPQARHLS